MSPATILIVEDNIVMRQLMAAFLKKQGYTIIQAEDGETAARQLEIHDTVDLILLDVQMKPMGGFAFLKTLQTKDISLPVILVTGDPSSDLLSTATSYGVRGVLRKPIAEDRLLQLVKRELENT